MRNSEQKKSKNQLRFNTFWTAPTSRHLNKFYLKIRELLLNNFKIGVSKNKTRHIQASSVNWTNIEGRISFP